LVESMKHQAEKAMDKRRNHHDAKDESDAVAETSLKLRRALDEVDNERQKVESLNEKLRRCEADLESIPLLRAQVRLHPFTNEKNISVWFANGLTYSSDARRN